MSTTLSYRPDLDGLRAVAVLAVLFYHAKLGPGGGFVGVDIFFVLSGYLITSIIVRGFEKGTFDFSDFWERRARRILPAGIVMVLVTLFAGWFLLLPGAYANLAESAIAQSVFSGNLYFFKKLDYFSGPAEEQPLLHTWSLAIEEQYYIAIPLLLWLLFAKFRLSRKSAIWMFLSIFAVSLIASEVIIRFNQSAVFFLLPFRAWELALGSIVSLVSFEKLTNCRWKREIVSFTGLVLVAISILTYKSTMRFPGVAALMPCLGAAALIVSGTGCTTGGKSIVSGLLSLPGVVFVGKISYSLYLWHWPILAYINHLALEEASIWIRLSALAASIVLSVISWKYVETPFRTKRIGETMKAMFVYSTVGMASVVVVSMGIRKLRGVPERYDAQVLKYEKASTVGRYVRSATLADARAGKFPRLGTTSPAPVRLMVWGDSHARSITPAIDKLAVDSGVGALAATYSATAPLLGYEQHALHSLGRDSIEFNSLVFEFIRANKIPNVLLSSKWSDRFAENASEQPLNGQQRLGTLSEAILHTVRELKKIDCQVWILCEVPNHGADVPSILIQRRIFGAAHNNLVATPQSYAQTASGLGKLHERLRLEGAVILDGSSYLYEKEKGVYRLDVDGDPLYSDSHHLTKVGALLISPTFAPIFRREVR